MKLLIIIFLCFFASSIVLPQEKHVQQSQNTSLLQSYAFIPVTFDTNSVQLQSNEIPKINVGDIVGQFFISASCGTLLWFIGYTIGGEKSSGSDGPLGGGPTKNAALFSSLGYGIGTVLGVYLIADREKYDPNLIYLFPVGILSSYLGYKMHDNDHDVILPIFILPTVATIITLNVFMRKKLNIKVSFDVQQLPQPNAYSYGMKMQYAF